MCTVHNAFIIPDWGAAEMFAKSFDSTVYYVYIAAVVGKQMFKQLSADGRWAVGRVRMMGVTFSSYLLFFLDSKLPSETANHRINSDRTCHCFAKATAEEESVGGKSQWTGLWKNVAVCNPYHIMNVTITITMLCLSAVVDCKRHCGLSLEYFY